MAAPKEKLFALHRHLGIERCVIVQTAIHGLDNAVVEDAIQAGEGRYLGIALVRPDVEDHELKRLAQAGFRGVRFNFMAHLGQGADARDLVRLSQRLDPLGMHLQVHCESALIASLMPVLKHSRVPVVIDHMGRVDAHLGTRHPHFEALLTALDEPHFYAKISGIDRIDPHGVASRYEAGVALARLLYQLHPHKCLWGSDWPHPNHTHIPDDGILLNRLADIAPNAQALQTLLVDNPQTLYRFSV